MGQLRKLVASMVEERKSRNQCKDDSGIQDSAPSLPGLCAQPQGGAMASACKGNICVCVEQSTPRCYWPSTHPEDITCAKIHL